MALDTGATLGIGTGLFVAIGVVLASVLIAIWGRRPNPAMTRGQAIKYILVCVTTAIVLMWIFWITCYIAQLNPMIEPQHSED